MGTAAEKKNNENLENRVLVFMPTGRDAALVCATLEKSHVSAQPCTDVKILEKEIAAGYILCCVSRPLTDDVKITIE